MPKVIMVCGRICAGKTTYARRLIAGNRAVLLSIDEMMLAMFGQHCGDMHEEYASRTERYLLDKSLEILASGIDVVLDWGFWRLEQRNRIKVFYAQHGIGCEMHLIEVPDDVWHKRIEKRNAAVQTGRENAYYIDENLARKVENAFEIPSADEVDIFVNDRCVP